MALFSLRSKEEGETMKVLILSPHPDDMEYNMGGTVVKMKANRWQVNQMIFSDCVELCGQGFIDGAKLSAEQLDVNTVYRGFPNQEFMSYRSAIREEIFDLVGFEYDIVFVPCRQDWHQDHQVITEEAIRIFRKNTTILGYIKDEIFDRHHDLRVDVTWGQASKRVDILKTIFGLEDVFPVIPEWFEVIQVRNYL